MKEFTANLHTISFIGSDKNAGKTTCFNFVYDKLNRESSLLCITSIGLNGERCDNYEGHSKPLIKTLCNHFFITAAEHLKEHNGSYQVIKVFSPPHYKKTFILGKTTTPFDIILEGPNEAHEMLGIKKYLEQNLSGIIFLIDGSIDRQFLAAPEISDAFYFALLISPRPEQIQKAKDLLEPLSFKTCDKDLATIINSNNTESTKTILFGPDRKIIHQSTIIPFMDEGLKDMMEDNIKNETMLYLNGALTKSLFNFFAPYKKLNIILDNFTLYHNITLRQSFNSRVFHPTITLLNKVIVEHIFINEQNQRFTHKLNNIPVSNIYKEDFDAIRINPKCH